MKLKLTNATWIFFLFLIAIVAYSCTPDKDNPENKSCSSTNKTGDCPDKKSCVNGLCIYQCSDTIPCPENYHCFESTCFDTQKLCSSGNHFGKCDGNDTCVEGVCKNLNPCNRDFPNGICSSENRFCYQGTCVEDNNDCKPWKLNGSCPENYKCRLGKCEHIEVKQLCSPQFPDGKCSFETDTCFNGLCMNTENSCGEFSNLCPDGQDCNAGSCVVNEANPCGDDYLFGYCEGETVICYNGSCFDLSLDCSIDNPFGACPSGSVCDSEKCVLGLVECDESTLCPDTQRQECISHKCVDKPIFCEDGAVNGLCPEGEACVASECKDITVECSLSNLNGLCNGLNLKCIGGECLDSSQENICSLTNTNGKCPRFQTCNDGVCEGDISPLDVGNSCIFDYECKTSLYCEKTFLDGYCTKPCTEESDCSESSSCYKVSDSLGYCLAKCSVNIPNSCARTGTENYICYPESGNDGACMYDCKYHSCFETGKTCNNVTGICN